LPSLGLVIARPRAPYPPITTWHLGQSVPVDDVVAVAVELASGEQRYVITWGRMQDNVDPAPLEALVLRHAGGFDLGGDAVSARVCDSLQEARNERYFFEALVDWGAKVALAKQDDHPTWRQEMAERMDEGRELYFLGRP
jgi:hypothetical protein